MSSASAKPSAPILPLVSVEPCGTVDEGFERLEQGFKSVHLAAGRPWTDADIAGVRRLADAADACDARLIVHDPCPELAVQLDVHRLHRRLEIRREDLPPLESPNVLPDGIDDDARELVFGFRGDPARIKALLIESTDGEAAELFEWLVRSEDDLYAQNGVCPYHDVIPQILMEVPAPRIATWLQFLSVGYAARVLCDDYTSIPTGRLAEIICQLQAEFARQLVMAMLQGADRPRRLAAILHAAGESGVALVGALPIPLVIRLIDSASRLDDAQWIVRSLSSGAFVALLAASAGKAEQARYPSRVQMLCGIRRNGGVGPSACDPRAPRWASDCPLADFRTGRGTRETSATSAGRHVRIVELLDSQHGLKQVRIDLLEVDPRHFDFRCVSAPRDGRPTMETVQHLFPTGEAPRPAPEAFERAGLFRLTERAEREGAVAAINGNFYFDYGHYQNGRILGFDCEGNPGLRFGDPVGWYVERGSEVVPPVLNRAALVINEAGEPWIGRVKMQRIRACDTWIRWDRENVRPRHDEIALFTPLHGARTPADEHHIDYCITADRIEAQFPGGDAPIPFVGFVLSVPRAAVALHEALNKAESLQFENDFPAEQGRVVEAMACGPQLVQDGTVDIDFSREEFGEKDSTVMSFFLPRLIDRYEAARSFLGTRRCGTVVLGTVSGRAFGVGGQDHPAGMTYGELAQLATDLGLVSAMGLDGGGSSSLVVRHAGGPLKTLNVPTGGSDVPRGSERFIANGIVVVPKQRIGSRRECPE